VWYGTVYINEEWWDFLSTPSVHWRCGYDRHSFRVVDADFWRWSISSGDLSPAGYTGFSLVGFQYKFESMHKYDLRGPRYGQWMAAVPFWFLIVVFSAVLFVVWRKTRPKIDPKTAFPVEVGKQ
jgi:hypothetical protein